MFLKKFHHRSDIGREYFQGDPKHMMKTIFDYVMSFSDPMMDYTPPPILNKQPLDPTIVVMEFVDEYRAELRAACVERMIPQVPRGRTGQLVDR